MNFDEIKARIETAANSGDLEALLEEVRRSNDEQVAAQQKAFDEWLEDPEHRATWEKALADAALFAPTEEKE